MTVLGLLAFVGIMLAVQLLGGGLSGFEGDGYSIDFPKGWEISAPPDGRPGHRWTARSEQFPLPTLTVIYSQGATEPSLLEHFEDTVLMLRSTVERFKLRSHMDLKVGDLPAKRATFTWLNPNDGVLMRSVAYYLVGGGRAWSITATSADEFFDEQRAWFDDICQSFELE